MTNVTWRPSHRSTRRCSSLRLAINPAVLTSDTKHSIRRIVSELQWAHNYADRILETIVSTMSEVSLADLPSLWQSAKDRSPVPQSSQSWRRIPTVASSIRIFKKTSATNDYIITTPDVTMTLLLLVQRRNCTELTLTSFAENFSRRPPVSSPVNGQHI
jgi:hypothetical protein